MYIKRDYSQPLFGNSKPRRSYGRVLFFFGMVIGTLLVYVMVNFESLQSTALDMVGVSPTATPLPSDLANVAANLVLTGDLQEAADLFSSAMEQRPENTDYIHEYGQLMIEMDDYDTAGEMAERILEIDPIDPRGYALRAKAYVWAGNPTAAIPVAIAGIDIDPTYAPLYSALARAYTNAGQYLDGVEAGLIAIETNPNDVEARRSYAYTLSWISENGEAIQQLEVAMMLDPNHVPTYFELALQYMAQNRDQEAIDLYDRVLALQPRNARAMLRLCEAYRKVGQFERAIGFCEDATNANPTSISAHYQLGILRYNRPENPGELPNFAGAAESFAACVELDPDNLDCTYRLGLAQYYIRECDAAWENLNTALTMAQNRDRTAAVEQAIENIRLGMIAIGQDCPDYSSIAPQPDPVEPEITPEVPSEDGGESSTGENA